MLFLALEVVALASREQMWAVESLWATSWMNSILILLVPVVAGVACAEAVAFERRAGDVLRRRRADRQALDHAWRGMAVGVWAFGAHLLGLVAAWTLVMLGHQSLSIPNLWLVAAAFFLLVAAGLVGSAVGRLVPAVWMPPLVAVLAYLLPAMQVVSGRAFLAGGASVPLAGVTYREDVLVRQMVLWLTAGVAVAVLVIRPLGRHLVSKAAAVGLVVAAAFWLDHAGPDDTRRVPIEAYACSTDALPICVPEEHRGWLPQIDGAARPAVSELTANLKLTRVSRIVTVDSIDRHPTWALAPTWLQAPYTDGLNVGLGVLAQELNCASSVDEQALQRIVIGAAPSTRASLGGAPPVTVAEAKAEFDRIKATCPR